MIYSVTLTHFPPDATIAQVQGLVAVVIPLRDVSLVERADSQQDTSAQSMLVTTHGQSSFLFSQLRDRDFVVRKISELLTRIKQSAPSAP